jgi:hypothetical protein
MLDVKFYCSLHPPMLSLVGNRIVIQRALPGSFGSYNMDFKAKEFGFGGPTTPSSGGISYVGPPDCVSATHGILIIVPSALLILLKQIVISIGASDACSWTQVRYVLSDGSYEDKTLCGEPMHGGASSHVLLLVIVELSVHADIHEVISNSLCFQVYPSSYCESRCMLKVLDFLTISN